mmetsp:Transcript_25706/g.43071  ORF Transcript_25706/g.43071 Transcript_25706/m.43071 type:complete len:178 (-) Transcript_25706:221-754(-)|eukprot:CAMPEP_0198202350 /NCGR_PEP_ID=MMETSP1445-20131203/5498_1 /TAXON_ID=36898 /ORGANISM="Pyramimonas sp., Strain CCMP2087" /LENGTH=177 /DNA_ID=CAMNT_0043873219 /DNA_START=258 /DNA_END=791 /DNA_ORIENTATION=-
MQEERQRGLRLAVEARTLGSRGVKTGADMGAVFMKGDEVVTWGYARSLLPESAAASDSESLAEASEMPAKKKMHIKTDVHAEQDAIAFAAKQGIPLQDTKVYITGPPCTTCFPLLIAAGVRSIAYVGTIEKVYKAENCTRFKSIAAAHGVDIVDDLTMPPYVNIDDSSRTLFRQDLE